MASILAWGARVSPEFARAAIRVAVRVRIADPSWLMAVMAFETGETFSPSIKNAAGSGATGLIQFMPQTAFLLQTSTDLLAKMDAVHQLSYVERYFAPWTGRLRNLGDVYGAVLWPAMIGKPDDHIVFAQGGARPKIYLQNRGLDLDRDGDVEKREVVAKVAAKLAKGLRPENASTY